MNDLATIMGHTAILKITTILDKAPDEASECTVDSNLPQDHASKIKAFKEAVGNEIFETIATGNSLNEAAEKHYESLVIEHLKSGYKEIKEYQEKYAPGEEMPTFEEFKCAVVVMQEMGN